MSEQRDGEARVDEDDEAFMEAWGSLKTYTLHAYSERYSPSIRHDGPNVRTYDADAVDALLARLRPAFQVGPADDPLTCSKCGGPTKENGRWHPDIGAVYGYELGLAERDPAPDTPEVAERPEKCPTCGGAVDDPGYDEINAGDQTGRDYCPDPFHTPESSDPDRYGETGGGEAPERADDPTDHSGEQAAGAGRESRAAISSEQRNYFAPLHPPVSSEEDRALVRRIKEIIGNADWPPDEAREPAKWDDRGSACGGARPVSSEEDRSMVRRWHRIGLYDAPQIRAILTDATTLAQYAKGEGRVMGWELTTFGDRPALRRELRGLNADGPADDLGTEVLQLNEGEVCYWRIDDQGRHRMGGTRTLVQATIDAPEHAEEILGAARQQLQRLAARERRIARNLITALEQGRYVDAEDIGEELRPWAVSKLAQQIAQVEVEMPAPKERGE